jgi:hypothetical protein
MPYISADRKAVLLGEAAPSLCQKAGELNYLFTMAALALRDQPPGYETSHTLYRDLMVIAHGYVAASPLSYQRINDVLGALVGAQTELVRRLETARFDKTFEYARMDFYRAVAVPYELRMIEQNGDVYPEGTPQ